MARGKKKQTVENTTTSNNTNVEQLTEAVKKLNIKGKMKKKSSGGQPTRKNLTPYQGNRECFGLYECEKCQNEWASSHSWANTWQECLECRSKVYPHRQWAKEKTGKKTGQKPHLQHLCEKCRRMGYNCATLAR